LLNIMWQVAGNAIDLTLAETVNFYFHCQHDTVLRQDKYSNVTYISIRYKQRMTDTMVVS
jgi:hypothetical protein